MSLTISITGHRPNRLTGSPKKLKALCQQVLNVIHQDTPDAIALSPLAEGADRIFAQAAVDTGMRLDAIFPFQEDDYRTTFLSPHSDDYFQLKDQAHNIHLMNGDIKHMDQGFYELGRSLVEASSLLVAIWDGPPGQGKGGTPEVIELAKASGKPVVWIRADGSDGFQIITHDHVADIEPDEILRFLPGHSGTGR